MRQEIGDELKAFVGPVRRRGKPQVDQCKFRWGIELPKQAAPLMKYAERLFSRPAFIEALTASEKVMRK